ncbi:MAG: hypothetical protein HY802_02980 [Methanobacterium sp.]|nr:hypothetical protein [Methanobacterium sp.]
MPDNSISQEDRTNKLLPIFYSLLIIITILELMNLTNSNVGIIDFIYIGLAFLVLYFSRKKYSWIQKHQRETNIINFMGLIIITIRVLMISSV